MSAPRRRHREHRGLPPPEQLTGVRGTVVAIGIAIGLGGGCAVDEPVDEPASGEDPRWTQDTARVDLRSVEVLIDDDPDLCGLATALPRSDVCSLLCDPDAFSARLAADGMPAGNCYQMRCDLGSLVVSVGVCL